MTWGICTRRRSMHRRFSFSLLGCCGDFAGAAGEMYPSVIFRVLQKLSGNRRNFVRRLLCMEIESKIIFARGVDCLFKARLALPCRRDAVVGNIAAGMFRAHWLRLVSTGSQQLVSEYPDWRLTERHCSGSFDIRPGRKAASAS
jgi:hypothetical protein